MKTGYAAARSSVLKVSIGLLSLSVGAEARAVEQSADNTPPPVKSSPASDSAGQQIEEIVVTANKRSESIQESPAAITAFNAVSLDKLGIVNALDLTKLVPGAQMIAENAVAQSFIRGVGSNIDDPYVDPGIGFNVNDISLPRYASGASFFDLARVEVLPGPQGTLYGGSASGGVVNLIPVQPENNLDGTGTLEGGNYASVHVFVAQNLPVSDDLSLRGAFDFERHDGYESRGLDSADGTYSGRISALWTPSADFKAYIFGSIHDFEGKPNAAVNSPLLDPGNPWAVPAFGPIVGNPVDASLANASYKTGIIGGRFDYSFDDLTLSYIPGLVLVDVRND